MTELDHGQAKLTGLSDPDANFDVEYNIMFTTDLRTIRSGLPPVANHNAVVDFVRPLDGRAIPAGEYLLHRSKEINRLKHLGGGLWTVLSWPAV